MSTHQQVAELLLRFWPMLDPEVAASDARALTDIPADELVDAIARYRNEDEHASFAPVPAKLRALCGRSKTVEARKAWEHVRSLPPMFASNDVRVLTKAPEAKAREDAWRQVYANSATRAAIKATQRFGGVHGLDAADIEQARRAFCFAYTDATERCKDELPPMAPASMLGFAKGLTK